jgi:putative acetyltransferase
MIQPLNSGQIEGAKSVIVTVCQEFFGAPPHAFEDMDAVEAFYTPPTGIFLVLLDGENVVGTGAIRRIDEHVCELKRMFFLPEYRGQGHGREMGERLLAFAQSAGYQRVQLVTSPFLERATRLYQKLGFHAVDCAVIRPPPFLMERHLVPAASPRRAEPPASENARWTLRPSS